MPEITITGLRIQPTSGVRTPKEIRAYARSDFQLNDAAKTLVKESSPHDSGPHIKVADLDADGEGWLADDFTLHSTTDSPNNPSGARWGLAVFDTLDRFMYWVAGLESFFLATSPLTANPEDIIAYNGEPITPAPTAERTAALYSHLNAQMEPRSMLPLLTLGMGGSLVIPADEYRLMYNSWYIGMDSDGGRYDLRDPSKPVPLCGVTINGLNADSYLLSSDPSLASYSDPVDTYHERLWQLETQLKTRYRGIAAAESDVLTLFGAHGAIITSVAQYDTPYFVGIQGDGRWLNLWNEMGDQKMFVNRATVGPATTPVFLNPAGNGVTRFGVRLTLPLTKYHMAGIRIGPGDPENLLYPALGGMTWVNVPADWSHVADPNTYLFRDDMLTEEIDTDKWTLFDAADGIIVQQDIFQWYTMQKTSPGWGTQGMKCTTAFPRVAGRVLEFDVLVRTDCTIMAGWQNEAGVDYTNFSHGMAMTAGDAPHVWENGVDRGVVGGGGVITTDRIYHVKITLNANGSATYQLQGKNFATLGSASWTAATPGTSMSVDNTLRPAFFVSNGQAYFNDVRVY